MNGLGVFDRDGSLYPIVFEALKRYRCTAEKRKIFLAGRPYPVIFCRPEGVKRAFCKNDFTAVISHKDSALLDTVKRERINAFTCGLCQKNSLTLSSFCENEASVCLTRQYKNLLPCEFSVKCRQKLSSEQLLLCSAALLLTVGYTECFFI